MARSPRSGTLRDGLTAAQVRLLERHRRGLAHVARALAQKAGRAPADILFVLAHSLSNVGGIAREQLGGRVVSGSEGVVVPGLTRDLQTWVERLAVAGPVVDCTRSTQGVPVVIIDEHNEMALHRLQPETAASQVVRENR